MPVRIANIPAHYYQVNHSWADSCTFLIQCSVVFSTPDLLNCLLNLAYLVSWKSKRSTHAWLLFKRTPKCLKSSQGNNSFSWKRLLYLVICLVQRYSTKQVSIHYGKNSFWVSTHHMVSTFVCGHVATGWHTLISMAMAQAGSPKDEVRNSIGDTGKTGITFFEFAWAWLGLQQAHSEVGDAKLGTSLWAVGLQYTPGRESTKYNLERHIYTHSIYIYEQLEESPCLPVGASPDEYD